MDVPKAARSGRVQPYLQILVSLTKYFLSGNTPAYFAGASVTKLERMFYKTDTRCQCYKTFFP